MLRMWLLGQVVIMFSVNTSAGSLFCCRGGICLTDHLRVGSTVSLCSGASGRLVPPSVCSRPRHVVADALSQPSRMFGDK